MASDLLYMFQTPGGICVDYQKVKSVSKDVITKGPRLQETVLSTMATISKIVGATLGPGGMPVLIERFEHDLPAMVTKDGVTVFRSLGFENSAAHVVMEAARDAAVRTANEAGDGTTTAAVLAEAIVRLTSAFSQAHPRVSPQKVVRRLEEAFSSVIENIIKSSSIAVDSTTEQGRTLLRNVAKISANGDIDLADAVMECFDLVGDDGNVTITEVSGPSHYEVERIDGFPIETGYEDSCGKFYPKFVNDPGTQRCVLEKPTFVLYHGRITEMQTLVNLMMAVGSAWGQNKYDHHNIVIFATGFSESVLAQLAMNFAEAITINVLPMLVPRSPLTNGALQFLQDLAAITGAHLFDPLNSPLEQADKMLGNLDMMGAEEARAAFATILGPGVTSFEASRYRSNVVGHAQGVFVAEDGEEYSYEDLIADRAGELETLIANPESQLDKMLLQERLGKLTNGIAKLKVVGSSNGELKEKRDRAEDAVCAVRGAIKHGCLPGGGWMLLKLRKHLSAKFADDQVIQEVLCPALLAPVELLLSNCGLTPEEAAEVIATIEKTLDKKNTKVYDALEVKYVDPVDGGVLDSTPAVLEAIRNSLSIASLLGSLGGTVVFRRDREFERSEARATQQFLRDCNDNPANERG